MASIDQRPSVMCDVTLRLSEEEARAFHAIVGYGWDSFIAVFEKHLGTVYITPHKEGGRLLFESVFEKLPPVLRRMDDARAVFNGSKVVVRSK